MKLYYGFVVIAQLLLAFLTGNKTRAAYISYLAQEFFSVKTPNPGHKNSKVIMMPESRLKPTHD